MRTFLFLILCCSAFLLPIYSMSEQKQAVKKNAEISLPTPSDLAEYLLHSPLDLNFFDLLEKINCANNAYRHALKAELVRLQQARFCSEGAYVVYDIPRDRIALNHTGDTCALIEGEKFVWIRRPDIISGSSKEKLIDVSFVGDQVIFIKEKGIEKTSIIPSKGTQMSSQTLSFTDGPTTCLGLSSNGPHAICCMNKEFYVKPLSDLNERMMRIPLEKHPFPAQVLLDKDAKTALIANSEGLDIVKMNRAGESMHVDCKNSKYISLSAQGNRLALYAEAEKNYVALYDAHTARLEKKLVRSDLTSLALSPCGNFMVMGFKSGKVFLYDIQAQEQGVVLQLDQPIEGFFWSGNSQVVAVLTSKKVYITSLCTRSDALPFDVIILVTKAHQFSTAQVCLHAWFNEVFKELKKENDEDSSVTVKELGKLALCNKCKKIYGCCKIYGCAHEFCRSCMADILRDRPRCPSCSHKIESYFAPDGQHTVSIKVIIG